ncbi:MAG: hypothetical protein ACO1TE_10920 [Prosthecobacter sp.]
MTCLSPAGEPSLSITKNGDSFRLAPAVSTLHYYGLEHSSDLKGFSLVGMTLGMPAPVFEHTPAPGELRGFFRAQLLDVFGPGDADQDGLDDLWELQHDLDPLSLADAMQPNAQDPARTNLEYYRGYFGLSAVTTFYSTETSVLNRPFAISGETSVYNFPALAAAESLSPEVSVYNFSSGGGGPAIEALSPEVSIYNAYSLPSAAQAFSAEVSVYNNFSVQPVPHAVSVEISVFNAPTTQPAAHALSPEVSILNTPP